ncbi:ribbon-helix-helix protein, CopG family [Patescibacteria group bacterium]|nr:ribbon-helix-helix protein, CopG family [Patescibacteria group bacterium]
MQRDRLTITLDHDLLSGIDQLVDKETVRNRSQAIEHLLREGLGLHQLRQAFLFLEDGFWPNSLETALSRSAGVGVQKLYLVLPGGAAGNEEVMSVIRQFCQTTGSVFEVETVPAEFGSGGALLFKKEVLDQPFLLFWPGSDLKLPDSLLKAYLFHRRQASGATLLLKNVESAYRFSGCAIGGPELIPYIPAGVSSLPETVFPQLLKDARIKAYLF